jgi:endogenous inhibitor of DNA gyrase (YacG/DUF329 family)
MKIRKMRTLLCPICGITKELDSNRTDKYCSRKCSGIARSGIGSRGGKCGHINCKTCGKDVEYYLSEARHLGTPTYCSPKCKHDDKRGKGRPAEYNLMMATRFPTIHQTNKYKSGHVFIQKLGREVWHRSSYEKIIFEILDTLDIVKSFDVEKVQIPYLKKGTVHYYVLDTFVHLQDGRRVLVEVKPKRFMSFDTNLLKFEAAEKYARNIGARFIVLTEDNLTKNSVETMLLDVNQVATANDLLVESKI